MASEEVNRPGRKRKSDIDLIFEVSENDCSPASTPEPVEAKINDSTTPGSDMENVAATQADNSNLETIVYPTSLQLNKISETNKVLILSKDDVKEDDSKDDNSKETVENIPEPKIEDMEIKPPPKKLLFTIKFCDKEFAELHETKITEAIIAIFGCTVKEDIDKPNLEVKFWEDKTSCDMDISDGECNEDLFIVDGPVVKPEPVDNLFMVDTTPGANINSRNHPKFFPKFKYDAIDELASENVPKSEVSVGLRQNNCFNCDGQHSLKDCKEPKNHKRIQMARSNFKTAFKSTRYHLDEEQKFDYIKPGKISEKLRIALNLGKYDIPNHVYHMRRVGYSPGWLEMAKVTCSDIKLFDFHGSSMPDNLAQESIDPDKVIEYPGFNVPFEAGCKDNYKERGCPAYSVDHNKASMLIHIEQAYLRDKPIVKQEKILNTIKIEKIEPIDEESDSNSQKTVKERSSRENSPTLTDLEKQKRQILDMLNDGKNICSPQTPTTESNKSINESLNNSIKTSTFGTPILKNCSPFERLPQSENFSKDISQVINFENLPNSTGKYEQMTQVINKVRKVIKYKPENKKS